MNKTETIRARVEPHLKAETEAIFAELGLSSSQAITLFYKQVALNHGLPFDVKIPNPVTLKAMEETLDNNGVKSYESLDDLKKLF